MPIMRGLKKSHEQNPQWLLRDTRTLEQRILDFFKNPLAVCLYLISLGLACIWIVSLSDILLIVGVLSFMYAYTRKGSLPFRLPMRSKKPDYNDLKPGTNKPQKARGIYYFGNDKETQEELWFSNEDMRTHVLIFGSTGSGKTEALISLAFNSLVQSSGFIYIDGKGDNSLFAKVFSMCRRMGREDDFLLINFMTGARDIIGPQEKRLSNTLNPFAHGSSSMLSQLVVSLMDSSGGNDPQSDMWKGRAINFVESLMRILVYMRDQGHILLDANTIRNYFSLDRLESIVADKLFIRDNQEPVNLYDVPEVVTDPIKNYLVNLPGYDRGKKGKQVSQVLEQHGFITMQLTRVFGSLADTYGHIIRTNLPEVDLRDVVLNRRILLVLLPALEKSPDELSNLGKVIIASLKAMMAAGLGDEVEGGYRELIQRKPTNAPTPYLCVMDEYGYYAVKGFAVVPAQARSLGFSAVFAGQDLPAFQKASKEEAASIGANTNIKICMKLEDPTDTWEYFHKTAGEAFVTKVDAFQTRPETFLNYYSDTRSASSERRARIDLLDLKDQSVGEAHIFFNSLVVRARLFYAAPPPVKYMRLNHFIKIEPVPMRKLIDFEKSINRIKKSLEKTELFGSITLEEDEVYRFTQRIKIHINKEEDLIQKSVAILKEMHEEEVLPALEDTTLLESDTTEGHIHIFMDVHIPASMNAVIAIRDKSEFSKNRIDKKELYENIVFIERLSGNTENKAIVIAKEIIKDMEAGTQYPPAVFDILEIETFKDTVQQLIDTIAIAKKQKLEEVEKES